MHTSELRLHAMRFKLNFITFIKTVQCIKKKKKQCMSYAYMPIIPLIFNTFDGAKVKQFVTPHSVNNFITVNFHL